MANISIPSVVSCYHRNQIRRIVYREMDKGRDGTPMGEVYIYCQDNGIPIDETLEKLVTPILENYKKEGTIV